MGIIEVEVAYALPNRQRILKLKVAEGATVESVILQSGILVEFPEIDLREQKVGVFGKVCGLGDLVRGGDRVEIYRPLMLDPKERRRRKGKK